jgi:hypothetical protein
VISDVNKVRALVVTLVVAAVGANVWVGIAEHREAQCGTQSVECSDD